VVIRKLYLSRLRNSHLVSVLIAVFVTLLWSSSWPIIKFGLEKENLSPFLFAGFRYCLGSLFLLIFIFISKKRTILLKQVSFRWWVKLSFYGFIFITLTQGAQFFGLKYLTAITVGFLLSFTPILVLIFGVMTIKEKPSFLQVAFVLLATIGAFFYFYPIVGLNTGENTLFGLLIVLVGLLANAISAVFGRSINRSQEYDPIIVTSISMFVGSILLLILGLVQEGLPSFTFKAIIYILWLSLINTALAFTLWNYAMQRLKAIESSIINNTMLVQITILALIFLQERPTFFQFIGLAMVALSGILLPILQKNKKNDQDEEIIFDTS